MSLQFRDRFRAGAHAEHNLNGQARDHFRAVVLAETGAAPDTIKAGTLQRFSTNGKPSDTAGWCQHFADGQAGVFGEFRTGMSSVWTAQRRAAMTPQQLALCSFIVMALP